VKQRVFIVDLERCFGCLGCVAACANANATPPGILWRVLHKLPPEQGSSSTRWLSLACNHCENPPCVAGCPSGALYKREEDGVVLWREEKCLGCRYCQMACPFDAIRWEEGNGLVSKCHFCHERLEEGREPACVETCFAGALSQRVIEIPGDGIQGTAREAPGFVHEPRVGPAVRFVTGGQHPSYRREAPFPPAVKKGDY
jgi:Fe-S-cluster-containing dehydrogenase component